MDNFEIPSENAITDMVNSLSSWILKQPHLPPIQNDKKLLQKFLVNCKYRIQKAKEKIDRYYSGRSAYPIIFGNRDPMDESIDKIAKLCPIFPLPKRTTHGELAIIMSTDPNINDMVPIDLMRYLTMVMDVIFLEEDTSLDFIFIADYRNFSYRHFLKLMTILTPLSEQLRSMYPGQLKADHFVFVPPFVKTVVTSVKKLVPKKHKARIHVHNDLDTFYEMVNRKILPNDLGGDEDSIEELNNKFLEKVKSHRNWFLAQENIRSIEELRPTASEFVSDEGSFRKFNID